MENINLKINGLDVSAPAGSTILEAAHLAGIKIPTLCYLKEINEITPVPLVLHGGSSNKDEEIHEAAVNGVSKVNIASDYRKAFFEQLTDTLNETHAFWSGDVYPAAIEAGKKVIVHKMNLFESIGKAELYK